MDKLRHFFLHNTELLLYIACWAFHLFFAIFFAPVARSYGYRVLATYNVTVSFAYAAFVLLFKNLSAGNIFFLFFYIESLVYSVLSTICTGADFGGGIFCVCIIPLLFLTTLDKHYKKHFYISFVAASTCASVFIFWWSYLRTGMLSLDFVTALTIYRSLYIAHLSFITVIMTLFLFYYSILTEYTLSRSRRKARVQAEELEYKANHDQLTGLMNRRRFNGCLRQAEYNKVEAGKDFSLTIFDIDGFKHINDTYGHDAGDFILQKMSALVSHGLKEGQLIARWGGEEFVILFPETGERVPAYLEQIRSDMEKQVFSWNRTDIHITLTFGVSRSDRCDNLERMIIEADNRLMWGKQHGKNQVVTE